MNTAWRVFYQIQAFRAAADSLGARSRWKRCFDDRIRFAARVDAPSPEACWIWQAKISGHGYGTFAIGTGHSIPAHRYAYEWMIGPIPDGLDIDHLCRVRGCVNPTHLEPVTRAENVRRGNSLSVHNGKKTHCPRGHEYTPENTRAYKGGRFCRACGKEKGLAQTEKRRAIRAQQAAS